MRKETLFELFSLQGKKALVTDLAKGLSQEIAPLLADAGASLMIADTEEAVGEALAQSIRDNGGIANAVTCNLVEETAVQALYERFEALYGPPDILVNCSALTLNYPFVDTSIAQLEDQFTVNLRSPFLLMREAVRRMVAAGRGGRIVNVSTMGTLHPVLEGNAIYAASRAALNMMCRNIAADHLKDRILVNVLLLGAFTGKVTFHADTVARMQAGHPLAGPGTQPSRLPLNFGNAWDVAATTLLLVGPSGGFITGQALTLDGGFLLT